MGEADVCVIDGGDRKKYEGDPERALLDLSLTTHFDTLSFPIDTRFRIAVSADEGAAFWLACQRLRVEGLDFGRIELKGELELVDVTIKAEVFREEFSVGIPIYNNSADQLTRCLCSIRKAFARTASSGMDVWVIDDHSQNGLEIRSVVEACASWQTDHIRVHYQRQPQNMGVSVARNTALELSRTNILFFIDADDEFTSHHFNLAGHQLKSGADVAVASMRATDGGFCFATNDPPEGILKANGYGSNIAVRKDSPRLNLLAKSGGLFNTQRLPHYEDWELNVATRFLGARVACIPVLTYIYHRSAQGRNQGNQHLRSYSTMMVPYWAAERVMPHLDDLSEDSLRILVRLYSEGMAREADRAQENSAQAQEHAELARAQADLVQKIAQMPLWKYALKRIDTRLQAVFARTSMYQRYRTKLIERLNGS
jgi:hypothetical protein